MWLPVPEIGFEKLTTMGVASRSLIVSQKSVCKTR